MVAAIVDFPAASGTHQALTVALFLPLILMLARKAGGLAPSTPPDGFCFTEGRMRLRALKPPLLAQGLPAHMQPSWGLEPQFLRHQTAHSTSVRVSGLWRLLAG